VGNAERSPRRPGAALRPAALVTGFAVALASAACNAPSMAPQDAASPPQATPTLIGVPPAFSPKPTPLPTPVPGPDLVVTATEQMTFEDDAITAYDFADDDHGWVAVGSTILSTLDGGQHWAPLYEAHGLVSNLQFVTTTQGFATVLNGYRRSERDGRAGDDFDNQSLLSTMDGGRTWQQVGSPTDDAFAQLAFVDAQIGWALAPRGAFSSCGRLCTHPAASLLRTLDGGETWSPVEQPCPLELGPTTFSFPDMSFGRVACMNEGGNAMINSRIFGTEDSGAHWQAQEPPEAPRMRGPIPISLTFADHEHGWLASFYTNIGGILSVTEDSGRSWKNLPLPSQDYPSFTMLHFQSPSRGGLILSRGRDYLLRTSDGGVTWSVAYPPLVPIGPVVFIDGLNGIAAGLQDVYRSNGTSAQRDGGDGGAILRTYNGGRTWSRSAEIEDRVEAFSFADADHGWALTAAGGDGGRRIYSTEDGGRTWTLLMVAPPAASEIFTSISQVSSTVGYAGTNWGNLLKTQDGGRSFQTVTRGGERPFYTFRFGSELRGWSIGNGELQETRDGGQTWLPRPLPKMISALGASAESRAWMVLGDSMISPLHPEVYSTADDWRTWTRHETREPVFRPLTLPNFVDDQHGWWQLAPGHLYVTSDGGKTWRWPR
jgi:photosystem II stability/assembly factor-like uncharacterized protein